MNSLSVFSFNAIDIRVVEIDGNPWFLAEDIIRILECDRTATRRLKDYEKGVYNLHTPGGNQDKTVISESGLYRLVLTSRKPQAEPFQDWVTQEVLPSIRKTGKFETVKTPELPQTYLEALKELVKKEEENILLRQKATLLSLKIEEDAPKVALANAIAFSDGSIDFDEFAKAINTGRTRLLYKMRNCGVLMKNSNLPYQRWIEAGYFEVSEEILPTGKITAYALITGKGQLWLKNRLDEFADIEKKAINGIANGVMAMI